MSAPTVASISPSSGYQGAVVVITGTNLTGATTVNFGNTPATSFIVNSTTQIAAVVPVGMGIPDVTVTTPDGTSAVSSADRFAYATYVPRDVVVHLSDYPWKFLVKNHNGVVTRTAVTDYSKANNYRNVFPNGFYAIAGGTTLKLSPPTVPFPATLDTSTNALAVPDDQVMETAGADGHGPRAESFTRVRRFFGSSDSSSTYECWDDLFVSLGDVDTDNELDG